MKSRRNAFGSATFAARWYLDGVPKQFPPVTLTVALQAASALLLLSFAFGQERSSEPVSSVGRARDLVQQTWASCAACHAAPDARVEHDARWIGLNRTTACLTGEAATPENRTRLIAFLEDGLAPRPKLYRSSREERKEGQGLVQVPSAPGSAFLRRTDGTNKGTVRIVWDSAKELNQVALPMGDYELVGYCFYSSEKGVEWTASATVQEGQAPDTIEVRAAKATSLPVKPSVYHDLSVAADGPELSIRFQLRNEAGDRMTLTRNGALVEPTWAASSADGKEIASGRFVPT